MLSVVLMAPVAVNVQEPSQTTIFRKELPKSRRLMVTREEAPYVPPTQAEIEKLHRELPDAVFRKPDHVWRYSLRLETVPGGSSKLLWTVTLSGYNDEGPWGPFRVLDADYNDNIAVVVFQSHSIIEGNITRKNNNFAVEKRTVSNRPFRQLLIIPPTYDEVPVYDAKITMPKSAQPLMVTLTDLKGRKRRFIWQKKWVEQKPKGKPIPQ